MCVCVCVCVCVRACREINSVEVTVTIETGIRLQNEVVSLHTMYDRHGLKYLTESQC